MSHPNDYGVSADYVVCSACGCKRPRSALSGAKPVCSDWERCVEVQNAVKAGQKFAGMSPAQAIAALRAVRSKAKGGAR